MKSFARIVRRHALRLPPYRRLASAPAQAQSADTSFFLTSNGIGNGGNLGGLAGADNHCQTLAQAAGAGRQDLARLPLDAGRRRSACRQCARSHRQGAVEECQGRGGRKDVAELHGANGLTKQSALSEKGEVINGRGDTPNRHDVLTDRSRTGRRLRPEEDRTCKNWTSSTQGAAMVGHSDRIGLRDDDASKSWNALARLARSGRRLLAGRFEEHRR
jgi:hypothetical protein